MRERMRPAVVSYDGRPSALPDLSALCAAGIGDDVAEVVDAVDGRPASAERQVGAGEQRAVLRVAAKVVPARQVVAERPQAPVAVAVPVERTEERVEGGRLTVVSGRDQGAARAGCAVAGVGLDIW